MDQITNNLLVEKIINSLIDNENNLSCSINQSNTSKQVDKKEGMVCTHYWHNPISIIPIQVVRTDEKQNTKNYVLSVM